VCTPRQVRHNRGSTGSLAASADLAEAPFGTTGSGPAAAPFGTLGSGLAAGRTLSGYDSANEGDAG
jgi:hypothetical protein